MADSIADELQRLAELRDRSVITGAEFEVQKARILGATAAPGQSTPARSVPPGSGVPTPAAKNRGSRHKIIGLSVVFLIVVIIAIASTATSSNTNGGGSGNNPATASGGGSADSGSGATQTSSVGGAVYSWYQGILTDFQQLESDFTSLSNDSSDESALDSDCTALTSDAQTLLADPPAPDSAINAPWQQALTEYALGGTDCSNGIEQQDSSLVNKGTDEITTGNSLLGQVTGQIKQLTGQ